ncbi:UNVERIFIED_CONTAM: Anaphase-promoting complex subunit [Sesamum radiatum]|uniref:Anaphase-promoting complex subunit n=1 Tax=Sesamum radiatum TaxID=300843 RepID=A0AAW2LN48_SESRA
MQAQALYLGRHYRRAFHLLNASQIVLRDLRFRYLAAKCLEELKEWDQCLLMLGDAKVDEHGNITDTKDYSSMYLDKDGEDREINALECLIDGHMLTCEEETNLLAALQFGPEDGWLSSFYSCLIKKVSIILTAPAAAMELGHSNELYLMACNLVKDYPQKCHLPTLYIGMEYMRTHSFKLAEQFFMQAQVVCPSDPLVYNELGVVAYHMKEYKKAVWWFEKTLAHVPSSLSEMWEPTVVNLAHALRKLRRYNEAIIYYEKALALSTRSLSTYAGLAYTYHLQDNFTSAITYYHKALWLKPDDQFCTEMLTLALADESRVGIDPKVETIRSQLFV